MLTINYTVAHYDVSNILNLCVCFLIYVNLHGLIREIMKYNVYDSASINNRPLAKDIKLAYCFIGRMRLIYTA